MSKRIHGVFLPLVFPAGIAPGEGGDFNLLKIARNGNGHPVLRGSAVAGALRHAWKKHLAANGTLTKDEIEDQVAEFFGEATKGDDSGGVASPLQVSDCILDVGKSRPVTRTHHLRNRHTGAVAEGALFALEACPAGTTTTLSIWLHDHNESPDAATQFLSTLVGLVGQVTFGGNAARGVGRAEVDASRGVHRVYDLSSADEYAAWLDDSRAWRVSRTIPTGTRVTTTDVSSDKTLEVHIKLGIPRGQDILVGDGQGLDHEIEPQRILAADGKTYWRLPGASLRGMFRGWVARLAARAGKPVADNVQQHLDRIDKGNDIAKHQHYNGDNFGWCFRDQDQRLPGNEPDCVVADLFGSLFRAGRLHLSDGYALCSSENEPVEEQLRMHVAVDRVTGGAAESMLFDNTVLTAYADGNSPAFEVTLRVDDPTEDEAVWLAKTLRALDVGILRVGSSKSSGRLALVAAPEATGPHMDKFQIEPSQQVEVRS